jgi:dihydropteroate synthase
MLPSVRISRRGTLTITLRGLSGDEAGLLRKVLSTSDRPDRPAFAVPAPGSFSIHGTPSQLRHCGARLAGHPQFPERIRPLLLRQLDGLFLADHRMTVGNRTLDLAGRTHLMGILNVTPDSFSDGGRYGDPAAAAEHAAALAAAGADIIDVGGESTRPGAEAVPEDEELRRIIPVIERIAADLPVPVSVDTYKSGVAARALAAGASIVNDISGLRFSPDMAKVVADRGAAVVIMHIKGTPRDMQQAPVYGDVIGEIADYLGGGIDLALRAGVARERIMIDPGIGFGKTLAHNLEVLDRLDEFRSLGCPIVIGTSRKRFIGTVLGIDDPRDRVEGTAATVALAIERGCHIVRVHDVAAMARVARMTDAIVRASTKH